MKNNISLILLAGGKGTRMGHDLPKQFLPLREKPIIFYSLEIFTQIPAIAEIVIVCEERYRSLFSSLKVKFALPGLRRQDSVRNGLQEVSENISWVCTHDGVRPCISKELVYMLFEEGQRHDAACLAVPVRFTVKWSGPENFVHKTLDREQLWECQTPQLIKKELFEQGFAYAQEKGLTVTDDVTLVELLGHPVKLVKGSYSNIKITTPEDLAFAEQFLS